MGPQGRPREARTALCDVRGGPHRRRAPCACSSENCQAPQHWCAVGWRRGCSPSVSPKQAWGDRWPARWSAAPGRAPPTHLCPMRRTQDDRRRGFPCYSLRACHRLTLVALRNVPNVSAHCNYNIAPALAHFNKCASSRSATKHSPPRARHLRHAANDTTFRVTTIMHKAGSDADASWQSLL